MIQNINIIKGKYKGEYIIFWENDDVFKKGEGKVRNKDKEEYIKELAENILNNNF